MVQTNASPNKYNAKSIYYDPGLRRPLTEVEIKNATKKKQSLSAQGILYFASTFEYRVYLELIKLYGEYDVICQYPVDILHKTKCCPNGKIWTIDFAVKANSEQKRKMMLIEAKGKITPSFINNLTMLEFYDKAMFRSLYLIFDTRFPKERTIQGLLKSQLSDKPTHPHNRLFKLKDFVESQARILEAYGKVELV